MPADASPVIALRDLSKRFGRTVAIRGLTLDVWPGEIFGFLGLNGAGKTTTIRILLDLLRPTTGHASVLGRDCQSDGLAARASIGYLPGEITFYQDLTGRRVLDLLAGLSAVPPSRAYQQQLLDRFEFAAADLGRRLREYSTGMKRKLGIVQAFQADPALLILDEPTEGLDPLMQEAFYALLDDVRGRGRTVFMSSHVLSEVQRVCSRIAVLRKGDLAVVAPVDEVRHRAPRRVDVIFAADVPAPASFASAPGVELTAAQPRCWSFRVRGPLGPLLARLSPLPVLDLKVEEPKLEDVVIDFYREGRA
jgi:ABC-2 type transport system ATP-binding protein